jgi:hypothetical protein
MQSIRENFYEIFPRIQLIVDPIVSVNIGSPFRLRDLFDSEILKARCEKVTLLLYDTAEKLSSQKHELPFPILQKEWTALLPYLKGDAILSQEMQELSRKIKCSVSQLADPIAKLPAETIPVPQDTNDPAERELQLHSEQLQPIVLQSYPGAILCAKGLLNRLNLGFYGDHLQKAANEISPALFSQDAFLKALVSDMIFFKIPFELCEFFSKLSTEKQKCLQDAIRPLDVEEFQDLFCEKIPQNMQLLFAETTARELIPADLFCAFLTFLQLQNQNDLSIFNEAQNFDIDREEEQAKAIQLLLSIPNCTDRSFYLAEYAKTTMFPFDKLKALTIVFQIPDINILFLAFSFLLKQVYFTEGREALFKLVSDISDDRNKLHASRMVASIVLERDNSDENLQRLLTFVLEIENEETQANCLAEISYEIHKSNPKKALEIGFQIDSHYIESWLANILHHFIACLKTKEFIEVLATISDKKHKELAYFVLQDVFEKMGGTIFEDWQNQLSSPDRAEFLYNVMNALSLSGDSIDDSAYVAKLHKNLMRFPADIDKAAWFDKIFILLINIKQREPKLAFEAAVRLLNKNGMVDYCAREMAVKIFRYTVLNDNNFRIDVEDALRLLRHRFTTLASRYEIPYDSENVIANSLSLLTKCTDETISALQIAKYIPIKSIREQAESDIVKKSTKCWADHHENLRYFTDVEMREYITEKLTQKDCEGATTQDNLFLQF